jgi:fatty acid desaturase
MQNNRNLLELQKPAAFRWILTCIGNWLFIAFSLYTVYFFQNIWSVLLSILIIGNRQHAIALLGHEGAHYMLSSNRTWNDFLTGFFAFWPLGINLPGYRDFHFAHHNSLGTTNDPELAHKKMNVPEFDLPITKTKMIVYFFKDIFCFSAFEVLQLISFVLPKKKCHMILPNLFLAITITSLIYFGFLWVVILWFIANLTSFWAFFRIRIYIEHIGTNGTHRIQSNPFLNWIFFPYGADTHWEHHEWPQMLWYNRDKARTLISTPPLISIKDLFILYEKSNAEITKQYIHDQKSFASESNLHQFEKRPEDSLIT